MIADPWSAILKCCIKLINNLLDSIYSDFVLILWIGRQAMIEYFEIYLY